MKSSQVRRPLMVLSVASALLLSGAALAGDNHPGDVDAKVRKMDTNQDGMVSAAEHAAGATAMFGEIDADSDGNVTAAEIDAHHANKRDMKSGDKMAKDKPHRMSAADKIREIDGNADGMLSAAEHEAGAARMFSEMDGNADGSLTAAEIKAGHQAKMGGHKTGQSTDQPKTKMEEPETDEQAGDY